MGPQALPLLLIFSCHTLLCSAVAESCVTAVEPQTNNNNNNCCCSGINQPCSTLDLGLSCIQNNNINSMLLIKGHLHSLNRSVSFQNPINVSIRGRDQFDKFSIKIHCSGAELLFFNAFNVSIVGLEFRKCGAQSTISVFFQTGALVFINSSVITLAHLTLQSSASYGAILSDSCGVINMTDLFIANSTGGGLKVTFHQKCNIFALFESMNVFVNGLANLHSQGGGLHVEISTLNVQLYICNSVFLSNVAHFGGGLYISMNGDASGNRIVVSKSKFSYNKFQHEPKVSKQYNDSRGGGVRIVYNTTCANNSITFDNECQFESNTAAIGAAFSLVSSHAKSLDEFEYNIVNLSNIAVIYNSGILGSAIHAEAMRDREDGFTAVLLINSCEIMCNHLSPTENQEIGTGVVYSHRIETIFYGINEMKDNAGSALCVSSTAVHFSDYSITSFQNNSGFNGGAIAITNMGYLVIHNHTSLDFINNSAVSKGGAIAVLGYGELNFATNHYESCFFKYSSKNHFTNLSFQNNTANDTTNSIFLPSLQQCYGSGNTSILCSKEWYYSNSNCHAEIETLAAYVKYDQKKASTVIKAEVCSGYQAKLPIKCVNDINADVTSVTPFFAVVPDNSMRLHQNSIFISDGYCTVYKNVDIKEPSHTLSLYTLSSRLLHIIVEIKFLDCPPGYTEVRLNKSSNFVKCKCSNLFSIKCEPSKLQASLYDTFCSSYVSKNKLSKASFLLVHNESEYLFAQCLFALGVPTMLDQNHYYKLPNCTSQFKSNMCSHWNRTGLFCSDCENNMGVNVASFLLECVNCSNKTFAIVKNVVLYSIGKFLPVVFFFLIIVLFRVNLTSGSINLYIWFCQAVTLREHLVAFQSHFRVNEHLHNQWLMLMFFPLAIWNLNFMEFFFPKLCISQKLKIIHVITLDYLTAVCPLLLIATSYILIELHARGFRPVMIAWKPFSRCIRLFRKNWNVQHSIIDVFAAFILLSYSKFTNITFSLLVPNPVYNSNGNVVGHVSFADASIKYGSSEHIPFLALAVTVLVIVIILPPLLLLLYPLKCFDWIHRHLSTRRRLALMTFVEAFQGCYKDGTNGTKDCRFIGSLYFFIRVLAVATRFLSWNTVIERLSQVLLLNCVIFIVAYFQPHKKPLNNKLDLLILFALAGVIAITFYYANPDSIRNDSIWLELTFFALTFIPSFCFTVYVLYRILRTTFYTLKSLICTHLRLHFIDERTPLLQISGALETADESLPDRLIHPKLY